MIPVGYAPSSVVLDAADNTLLVANDKGIGTTGLICRKSRNLLRRLPASTPTRTLAPSASSPCRTAALATMTTQVYQNNHWDLAENIASAAGGNPIPRRSQSRRRSAIPR